MNIIERLKSFDSERSNPDEMVELSAGARILAAEYQTLGLESPDWLEEKRVEVKRELDTRLADMKAKRIRELKAKLATLKTAEERRSEIAEELARLEQTQ